MQIVEEVMSTTDSIVADVSGTQITQESSGSLDPDDECKYLAETMFITYIKLYDECYRHWSYFHHRISATLDTLHRDTV